MTVAASVSPQLYVVEYVQSRIEASSPTHTTSSIKKLATATVFPSVKPLAPGNLKIKICMIQLQVTIPKHSANHTCFLHSPTIITDWLIVDKHISRATFVRYNK
jgi:hypothetical protein